MAAVAGVPYPDAVAVPTFADGLAEMQVLDAVRASAQAGGAVTPVALRPRDQPPYQAVP